MSGWRGRAARVALALVATAGAAHAQPAPAGPPPQPTGAATSTPQPGGVAPQAPAAPGAMSYPPPAYGYAPGYAAPGYPPTAWGAPAPAPAPAPDQQKEHEKTPEERAHDERVADAHADRVVVLPTAYTHPKGTLYLSSYDIVLLQAGYATSDTTQVTLTATPPLGKDHIFPVDFSVKTRIVDEPGFRFAVLGSASGISGLNEGPMFLGRVGAVAQFCFDRPCGTSITLGSNLVLAGPAMLTANGAGLILPTTHWLTLLFEVETLFPLGREVGQINGIAAAPGVRFPFKNWALDLTVARIISGSDSTRVTAPILVFTYRFLP